MLRAVSFDMSGQVLVTACQNGPWSEVESSPQWPCVACNLTRPVTDCCVTPPCRPSSGMLSRSRYDRCLPSPFRFTIHPIIPHQSRFEAIAIHATALGRGVVPNVLLHTFLSSVDIEWLVGRAEKVHWAQNCHTPTLVDTDSFVR